MVSSAGLGGKKVLVMGLGLHGGGVSVARWLSKHGARVTATDLKTKKQLAASIRKSQISNLKSQIRFILGRHRAIDFRSADIVVQNPAVPRESSYLKIARKAGATIENEATLFFKYCKSKNIIGVTGTRGKSTTAAMIAEILHKNIKTLKHKNTRVFLAGNIRTTPMLSIVDRIRLNDWVVLELSSWHLENMGEHKISPHIAVVTNILDDHMNRYKTKASYAAAKENIVRYQKRDDVAVLNKVNLWTRAMAKKTKARIVWFPNNELRIANYASRGAHFLSNAQAAATVAHVIGVPKKIINDALKTFHGLPDRQEIVRVIRGVSYVNDTTATTPDATIAALQRFSKREARSQKRPRIILICGGTDKKLNYKPLIPWIKKTCKVIVLLPGTATEKIEKEIKKFRNNRSEKLRKYFPSFPVSQFPIVRANSMHDAVAIASKLAQQNDIILLSPAAASFGLFQHEFDRGDQFRQAVRKL